MEVPPKTRQLLAVRPLLLTLGTCVGHLVGAGGARGAEMSETQRPFRRFSWCAEGRAGVGTVQTSEGGGLPSARTLEQCGGEGLLSGRGRRSGSEFLWAETGVPGERSAADRVGALAWPGLRGRGR